MNSIIIINGDDGSECTKDSIKYKKNCCNFISLNDGTSIGDYKYCNLSLECRQIDVLFDGTVVPMESHYISIINPITGEVIAHDLFCTGMHDLRPLKERIEDNKVS